MIEIDTDYPVSFNALDRCDRCPGQAYSKAYKKGVGELLWCIHHSREFRRTLLATGWKVFDDAEALIKLAEEEGVNIDMSEETL